MSTIYKIVTIIKQKIPPLWWKRPSKPVWKMWTFELLGSEYL